MVRCSCFSLDVVLVAHNGYVFDFPMLLAEIERRPEKLSLSQLSLHKIYFADTLRYLKQVSINLEYHRCTIVLYLGQEGWSCWSKTSHQIWSGKPVLPFLRK